MSKPPLDPHQLERYIGAVLREQPLRRAPASLEARVLQMLALQATRPWWLRGFSLWPRPARVLFLPLSIVFVQLAFLAAGRVTELWESVQRSAPADTARSALQIFGNLGQAVQTLADMVTRNIPSVWVYGTAGLALLLCAALFGLGAAAFRTLALAPEPLRY